MLKINSLFKEFRLYDKLDLKIKDVEDNTLVIYKDNFFSLCNLIFPDEKPHLYCNQCMKTEPFSLDVKIHLGDEIRENIVLDYGIVEFNFSQKTIHIKTKNKSETLFSWHSGQDKLYYDLAENESINCFIGSNNDYILSYYANCLSCEDNGIEIEVIFNDDYIFFSDNKFIIKKVYPSTINFIDPIDSKLIGILKKYKADKDYKAARNSYFDKYFIAGALYLRRTFEKMILHYMNKLDISIIRDRVQQRYKKSDLTDFSKIALVNKLSMRMKIEMIKSDYMSPNTYGFIDDFYKIISTTIHEKEEKEAKTYYDHLIVIINMQLLFEVHKEEERDLLSRLSLQHTNIMDNL